MKLFEKVALQINIIFLHLKTITWIYDLLD